MQVGKLPDQYPFVWHVRELLPDKMYPVGQVYITVSPKAVPLTMRVMPALVPGSPQPPAHRLQNALLKAANMILTLVRPSICLWCKYISRHFDNNIRIKSEWSQWLLSVIRSFLYRSYLMWRRAAPSRPTHSYFIVKESILIGSHLYRADWTLVAF